MRDEIDLDGVSESKFLKTTIFNTDALKWMDMLLGMDGMSYVRCIYYHISKREWILEGHDKGEPR